MDESGTESDDRQLQFLSREELEERFRQRTSEIENVMGAMVDVLIKLDGQGNISMINEAVTEILGYEPSELEGKPVDILLTDPPSDSQSPVSSASQLLERLLGEGKVTDMEVYCSTADGETVPMSLSASMLEDDDGVPTGIVCVAKDITERKEAEQQAAFLHSLLRHDLSNRLQVSAGFLEMLADTDLEASQRQHLDRSLDALDDAGELVENVRKLDRIDGSESLQPTDLEATITEAVHSYETLRREQGIDIELDLDEVTVLAGTLLIELFTNLIENSLVHSNAETLRISTTLENDTVTVVVEDDGEGLDPEIRDQIFERGYTAGETAGSGLGTYIVSELAESYGGDVTATESPLGGARFEISLQRATGSDS